MRKVSALVSAGLIVGAMFLAAPAGAEPSDSCGGDKPGVVTGASSVTLCGDTFAVTVAYLGGTNGYVISDGDSGNDDPADGYIGLSDKGVACSDEGDYDYATDAHDCGM